MIALLGITGVEVVIGIGVLLAAAGCSTGVGGSMLPHPDEGKGARRRDRDGGVGEDGAVEGRDGGPGEGDAGVEGDGGEVVRDGGIDAGDAAPDAGVDSGGIVPDAGIDAGGEDAGAPDGWSPPPPPAIARLAHIMGLEPDGASTLGRGAAVGLAGGGAYRVAFLTEARNQGFRPRGNALVSVDIDVDLIQVGRWNPIFGDAPILDAALCAEGGAEAYITASDASAGGAAGPFRGLFVYDFGSGAVEGPLNVGIDGRLAGDASGPAMSPDCGRVAYETDAPLDRADRNGGQDIAMAERGAAASPVWVSRGAAAAPQASDGAFPVFSADGEQLSFLSLSQLVAADGDALIDGYSYNTRRGVLDLMGSAPDGNGNGHAVCAPIVAGGVTVMATRAAGFPGAGDTNRATDIYLWDRPAAPPSRIVRDGGSEPAFDMADADVLGCPSVSADGKRIAFATVDPLVAGDRNGLADVYVYDRTRADGDRLRLVTVGQDGAGADGDSTRPSISPDGAIVVFQSDATNLVEDDTNGVIDVFAASVEGLFGNP